jgi:hypothetical protein
VIDFPANPIVGQAFQVGSTVYKCVSINPAVWSATTATSGIPDAPVDAFTYGRKAGAWKILDRTDVGLSRVDNTNDAEKPISTATANALAGKEPTIIANSVTTYYRGDKTWQTLNPAATGAVAKTGDTMTGNLTMAAGGIFLNNGDATINGENPARSVYFALKVPAGSTTESQVLFYRGGASTWRLGEQTDGQFVMTRWSGGAYADTPLWIDKATGRVNIGRMVGAATQLRVNADPNGTAMTFAWSGQGGQPSWLWGSNDGATSYVYNPSNFSVSRASTCGTADNANALGGIGPGGWCKSDWINTCGLASNSERGAYMRRTSDNALCWLVGSNTSVGFLDCRQNEGMWITHQNGTYMGGVPISTSDIRAKQDIKPSTRDGSADVKEMEFINFRFLPEHGDPDVVHDIGFSAQNLQGINPSFVMTGPNGFMSPNSNEIIATIAKSLQEALARIDALEARQ